MSGRTSAASRSHSQSAMRVERTSMASTASAAQASSSIGQPLLSRPTLSAIAGKQTATLKTSVTDEVKEQFTRWSREHGYATESDCLRELVLVTVYGPAYLTDLHRQRIASLVANRDGIGTEAGA